MRRGLPACSVQSPDCTASRVGRIATGVAPTGKSSTMARIGRGGGVGGGFRRSDASRDPCMRAPAALVCAPHIGFAESRLASLPRASRAPWRASGAAAGWAVVFVGATRVAIHACEPPRRSFARRTSGSPNRDSRRSHGQAERRGAIRLRGATAGSRRGRPAGVFVACRSAKKLLNPASFGGYSFSTAANRTVVSKMVHEA